MAIKLTYVDYGIANRYEDKIEMNKKLLQPQYIKLHTEILRHELNHTNTGWSLTDFKLDLTGLKNKRLYWKFILTTPKSWVQFSPIYTSEKQWYFDITLILFYVFTIAIGIIAYNLGLWIATK